MKTKDDDFVILIAEDDEGHARLIKRNLSRAGVVNPMLHFKDGQEILDFLFAEGDGPHRENKKAYLILLDIRMPRVDGVSALKKIKADGELCKIPVIMLTTSDNPAEISHCHSLGCSNYIRKPTEYDHFETSVKCLGNFLGAIRVPKLYDQADGYHDDYHGQAYN